MQGQLGLDKKKPVMTFVPSADNKELQVYLGFRFYESIPNDPTSVQYRLLVARLAIANFSISELARTFGFSRPTIDHYRDIVTNSTDEEEMLARLRGYHCQKTKLTPAVEAYITARFETVYADNRGSYNRQLRQEVQALYKTKLSPEALRRVISPRRQELDRKAKETPPTSPPAPDQQPRHDRVSELSPIAIDVAPATAEAQSRVDDDTAPLVAEANPPATLEQPFSLPEPAEPEVKSEIAVPDEQKGQHYLHAGLLVLNLWLAEFAEGFRQWRPFLVQWLYQIFAGAVNFEQARYLERHELGRFVGQAGLSVSNNRGLLAKLAQRFFEPCLKLLFQVNLERIAKPPDQKPAYFYLDGHFDPYYGKTGILKGWCSIFHRAMKGTNHYVIHNELGYPISKELKDCFKDFRVYIKHAVGKIKSFLTGVDFGMVFDRGGFAEDLFRYFYANHAYFLTWEKYFDIAKETALDFGKSIVTIAREINDVGHFKTITFECAETTYRIDANRTCRKLVIRTEAKSAEDDAFCASILTNDPASCHQRLVELMTGRWCQENDFKYEKKHFGLDQITSYDATPPQSLRDQIDEHQGRFEALKKGLAEGREKQQHLLEQLGVKRLTPKLVRRIETVAAQEPQRYQLLQTLQTLQAKLQKLPQQITQLEKQINRLEKIEAAGYVQLDYRKKQIFDHLRFTARNIFYNAVAEFRTVYTNLRDLHVVFWKLVQSPGYIKAENKQIVVTLICPFDGKVRQAIQQFLAKLNTREPILLDGSKRQIFFRLQL